MCARAGSLSPNVSRLSGLRELLLSRQEDGDTYGEYFELPDQLSALRHLTRLELVRCGSPQACRACSRGWQLMRIASLVLPYARLRQHEAPLQAVQQLPALLPPPGRCCAHVPLAWSTLSSLRLLNLEGNNALSSHENFSMLG